MLHHTFGATSVAMSTVLSAFMGGLGLGAYWFGKRAASFKNPLVVYALAELGVALCALIIPPLVRSDGFFSLVNAALREQLGEGSFEFMVARFFCVLPILLVPTTLMGGTLPLLAQHFVQRPAERTASPNANSTRTSARVGALYALNTFGAVAGTALSSFVLMPAIGVQATNLVAVAINAALGAAILLVQTRRRRVVVAPEASAAPQPSRRSDSRRRVALLAFALSGVCSMAYEVVWSRALAMAIGSSLQSFALILITFLIGIAGGSAVASHLLGTTRSRGLILLSFASGGLALLALAPALVLSSAALASAVLLLVWLGLFVFARTAIRRAHELTLADEELRGEGQRLLDHAALRCLLVPCALAAFEVVRFALKRSTLAGVALHGYLPYVTASTVCCIALALALLTALRSSPWLLAGGVQLCIALSSLASYAFQDEIPYSFARLVTSVDDLPSHVGTVRFFMLLAAGLCTLPAALGMGAMFPVTLELWSGRSDATDSSQHDSVGRDVGRVYGANTVGSIVGAWLPGFVLLPLLGMERTLAIGITVNAAVALLLLYCARTAHAEQRGPRRGLALGALVLIAAVLLHSALPRSPLSWNLAHMTLGAFRMSLARQVLDPESWGQPDLLYYRDGISTTVSVERWGGHLSLKNNGKVDASNGDDMPTQIMVAAYPLLLHPQGPRDLDVAIVGFGSGVTVGAALEFPLGHIDNMELEDAVIDAALRFFSEASHLHKTQASSPYLSLPRLSLYRDDGRNFLAATNKRYDVIVSEPSNPWITGVSDLFTVDHFQITKRKLKPGGVYCQWVQLYELSPENIKTVYRTFATQYRYVLAFSAAELSPDTILVGSDEPLLLDLAHVERSLREPRIARELARADVHSAEDVWSRLLFASREELLEFAQTESRVDTHGSKQEIMRASGRETCIAPACRREPVPLNTDDNMLIELRAPSDLIGFKRYEGYLELFYGASWPYGDFSKRLAHVEDDRARLRLALSLLAHGRKERARFYRAQTREVPTDRTGQIDQRAVDLLLGIVPEPVVTFEPAAPGMPMTAPLRAGFERTVHEAEQAFERADYRAAAQTLEGIPAPLRALSGPSLRFRFALAVYRSADRDHVRIKLATAQLEELIVRDEAFSAAHPELYYFLARALEASRSYGKAARTMQRYAALTLPP
ncbi:MAG: hypothetical protein JWN04_3542 [Myxococcaceae bacterium]|nr:hypothetical protein [Myxococcaceae bacterium]